MLRGLIGCLQQSMIKQALKYMEKDPDKNLPKLLAWAEKIDTTGYFEKYIEYFRGWIEDEDNNWNKFMKSLWTDIDDGVRMRFLKTLCLMHAIRECRGRKSIARSINATYLGRYSWTPLRHVILNAKAAGRQSTATG